MDEQVFRQIIREEFAKVLSIEENAIADCMKALNDRLAEVEKSCALMVSHGEFMEKALIRVTEAAQRPNSDEAEEWRKSLGDDAGCE